MRATVLSVRPGDLTCATVDLRISRSISADHAQIERLVAAGFAGLDHERVAVHLKARGRRVLWLVECGRPLCGRRAAMVNGRRNHVLSRRIDAARLAGRGHGPPQRLAEPAQPAMTGRAYDGVPSISSAPPGTRYLITLIVPPAPQDDTAGRYPLRHHYHRARSVAPVLLPDWRAELVHLVAHEAAHVAQFRAGRPRSEVECERWAALRVGEWLSSE